MEDSFVEKYDPTIACDFATRMIEVNGRASKLHIIDHSGSPKYDFYGTSWMKDMHAFVFVFD
ncbi:hypothetical protein CPB86DRAFT_746157, partial [Serendipita vermifera]